MQSSWLRNPNCLKIWRVLLEIEPLNNSLFSIISKWRTWSHCFGATSVFEAQCCTYSKGLTSIPNLIYIEVLKRFHSLEWPRQPPRHSWITSTLVIAQNSEGGYNSKVVQYVQFLERKVELNSSLRVSLSKASKGCSPHVQTKQRAHRSFITRCEAISYKYKAIPIEGTASSWLGDLSCRGIPVPTKRLPCVLVPGSLDRASVGRRNPMESSKAQEPRGEARTLLRNQAPKRLSSKKHHEASGLDGIFWALFF